MEKTQIKNNSLSTCRKVVRDKSGRFPKGISGNPKGHNQFTSLVPLLEALKKSGEKYNEDFWEFVASKVRTSDAVLIAILKKLLPDKVQGEGLNDNIKIVIVRENKTNERIDNPS